VTEIKKFYSIGRRPEVPSVPTTARVKGEPEGQAQLHVKVELGAGASKVKDSTTTTIIHPPVPAQLPGLFETFNFCNVSYSVNV